MNTSRFLSVYLKEAGRYELLSKEDTIALATSAKSGDKAARTKLINSNLRLVVKIASEYYSDTNKKVCLEDLISSGNIGLVIAADKYDPEYQTAFSTYAQYWIRDQIRSTLHISHDIVLPAKKAKELSKTYNTFADSMDDEAFRESQISNEGCVNLEQDFETELLSEYLDKVLSSLPEREESIIRMHYGIGSDKYSLSEIGVEFGFAKQRIQQIEQAALLKIKNKDCFKYIVGYCA